jgi:hypothetical protein
MRKIFTLLSSLFLLSKICAFDVEISQDMKGWKFNLGRQRFKVVKDSGMTVLQLEDESVTKAGNVSSPFYKAKKGGWRVTGKLKVIKPDNFNIKIRFYDKNHRQLEYAEYVHGNKSTTSDWQDFTITAYASRAETAYLNIGIYSWYLSRPKFRVADVKVEYFSPEMTKPVWTPQYKIRPHEKQRLTAADVVGPDGIVYPDFSRAGLRSPVKCFNEMKISKFGGFPNDGKDDYEAFRRGIATLAQAGGGTLVLDAGKYELGHPVYIPHDNIIIKGAGRNKTHIKFTFGFDKEKVRFCWLKSGDKVGADTSIISVCEPKNLASMRYLVDGRQVYFWRKPTYAGNTSSVFPTLKGQVKPGKHTLTVEANYHDKRKYTKSIVLDYQPEVVRADVPQRLEAIFMFAGKGFDKKRFPLQQSAKRGDNVIYLPKWHDLKKDDFILIQVPTTEKWKKLVSTPSNAKYFRDAGVMVAKVEGGKITLNQPLRIDIPGKEEGSFAQKIHYIKNCAVMDFSLEQLNDVWLIGVFQKYNVNCMAKGVKVKKAGRNPIYAYQSKFCYIVDCIFDDAWFKDGGGTAYAGWECSFDCLMENVTTYKLRHGPSFQWAASGNVIRKSVFNGSDGQWHSGWTHENLVEQCLVYSIRGTGSYGYGFWASPPEDGAHGPNGPRNVVYNNDVFSEKTGVLLGGMNENYLILYNRFTVDSGHGIFVKSMSFDHIIKGNIFGIKSKNGDFIYFRSPDCSGIEAVSNTIYGGRSLFGGLGKPFVNSDNKLLKYQGLIPFPNIKVPSIYEWQKKHKRK